MKKIETNIITIHIVECPHPDLGDDIIPVTFEQCKKCEYFGGFVMDDDAIYCLYEGEQR